MLGIFLIIREKNTSYPDDIERIHKNNIFIRIRGYIEHNKIKNEQAVLNMYELFANESSKRLNRLIPGLYTHYVAGYIVLPNKQYVFLFKKHKNKDFELQVRNFMMDLKKNTPIENLNKLKTMQKSIKDIYIVELTQKGVKKNESINL